MGSVQLTCCHESSDREGRLVQLVIALPLWRRPDCVELVIERRCDISVSSARTRLGKLCQPRAKWLRFSLWPSDE